MECGEEKLTRIEKAWPIYTSAFPVCERRSLAAYGDLCRNEPGFEPDVRMCDGHVRALMWYWKTPEYTYLEHFAVTQSARNHGYGGELVRSFIETHAPVILEVEPPTEDIRRRRIGFYQRNGMVLNDFTYMNPGYGLRPEPYPLCLMSSRALSEDECQHFVNFVMSRVLRYIG